MPSGSRIRANNVFGSVDDNPLSSGALVLTSNQLTLLPTVAGNHAIITLDPLRQFGDPEIIVVTAHTGGATVATITRGAYGTTPRAHPQGTFWTHAIVTEDVITVATSSTRPSDPYEGQMIFETDTNRLVGYGGIDWASRDAGGLLGYSELIGGQTNISTEITVTNTTVVVNIPSNRRILVKAHAQINNDGTIGTPLGFIWQDGVTIGRWCVSTMPANGFHLADAGVILTPSAGNHTYLLRLQKFGGAGTIAISNGDVAYIAVIDLGAV